MMGKRVSAVVFSAILLCAALALCASQTFREALAGLTAESLVSGEFADGLERAAKESFPGREDLSSLAWNLRYRTGAKEIDGYFMTGKSIIKNVGAPDEELVESNNAAILDFAQRFGNTYFCLIPTACAIKQQDLPEFAISTEYNYSTVYNQKRFIDEVYREFGGQLYTADVYSALVANQNKYLYYNTESRVTSLGGYYIYTVLGEKLDAKVKTLESYTVEYAKHNFEGSLGRRFPYAPADPDLISFYHYRAGNTGNFFRVYETYRMLDGEWETLGDLYDREKLESGSPLDAFFGGPYQMARITVMRSENRPNISKTKLLIIGDDTAQSYVPFIAPSYAQIQVVNAACATEEQIREIDALAFDQVLFAFSADTYMHNPNLEVLWSL